MGQAQSKRISDDEIACITLWRFSRGDSTGQHRHGFDITVVPVTGGTFDVTSPEGQVTHMVQQRGRSYSRSAGVAHEVTSTTDYEAVFLEIELKHP